MEWRSELRVEHISSTHSSKLDSTQNYQVCDMAYPLAIFTPRIGAYSETFIHKHIERLLPGQTVVLAHVIRKAKFWETSCPTLILSEIALPRFGKKRKIAAFSQAIRQFLSLHSVEVMMGEFLDISLPIFEIVRDMEIPFYVHSHGYDMSERLEDPMWREAYLAYNGAAGIITVSEFSKNRLIDIGLEPGLIKVVPYGIDVPDSYCQRTSDIVYCLTVGRMVSKKAPLITIKAFEKASRECPNLYLDFIGDGVLFSAVKDYVEKKQLSDKITLHGSQPNDFVLYMMKKSEIFLQHSMTDPKTGNEEGLPVAILEAMANGLPIVTSKHAGIPEAVISGVNGYLVNEGDENSMAQCIIDLYNDSAMREKLGRNSWLRAKENFSYETERRQLLEVMNLHDV